MASGTGITAGAGDLHAGAVVTLTANLSQAVTVSGGTPTLVLNDGGTATYTGGSGTAALTFSYTVAAGQNTADLAVTAVQLNGATVGTGAPTLLPPGSGQSLTDANGHVFSFGAVYTGPTYFILRDGLPDGSGTRIGAGQRHSVGRHRIYGWYADNAGTFTYQANAPTLDHRHRRRSQRRGDQSGRHAADRHHDGADRDLAGGQRHRDHGRRGRSACSARW